MKTTLTIILALIVSAGMAQFKKHLRKDSVQKISTLTGLPAGPFKPIDITYWHAFSFPDSTRADTVRCWFKEVDFSGPVVFKIVKGQAILATDDYPEERWQYGYVIKGQIFVSYLYSDRKTKVTNHVLYSFEK